MCCSILRGNDSIVVTVSPASPIAGLNLTIDGHELDVVNECVRCALPRYSAQYIIGGTIDVTEETQGAANVTATWLDEDTGHVVGPVTFATLTIGECESHKRCGMR